eukprot:3326587-Prymnesium_polylepis.1
MDRGQRERRGAERERDKYHEPQARHTLLSTMRRSPVCPVRARPPTATSAFSTRFVAVWTRRSL